MGATSKQDRQGARTAADIERKYSFGKTFAEVMGIAEGAQKVAEEAKKTVAELDQEAVFKLLTNNGKSQGVFRSDDGEIYINAAYIVSISEMFAKDISMTGTLTNTVEAFIEPGQVELDTLQQIILSGVTPTSQQIALYDFNGDGELTSRDLLKGQKAMLGADSLADWSGAVKSTVTLTIDLKDPEKAIKISGTNMWGRDVSGYIGINGTSFPQRETADYVVERGTETVDSVTWTYRKWNSGIAECWGKFASRPSTVDYFSVAIPYPFTFAAEPNVTLTDGGSGIAYHSRLWYGNSGGNAPNNTTTLNITYEDVTNTGYEVCAYIQVVGRWK